MAIRLGNIRAPRGAKKNRKRVGRGEASGWGKTAARGENGQKSRSGGGKGAAFEGGQLPLIRRIPKRGFHSPFRKVYSQVNIEALNRYEDGTELTIEKLRADGLAKGKDPVKILGGGELERKLIVKANAFSGSARAAIEAKGGKAEAV